MAKKYDINKELSNTIITDKDITQVNDAINEKFNLYFGSSEAAILKKIATPNVIYILKNINALKIGKDGALSIDSLYKIANEVEKNLQKTRIKNPYGLFALFDKLVLIFCYKIQETDDLTNSEKFHAIKTCLHSVRKFENLEQFNLNEIFPKGYYTLTDLMAKYNPEHNE